MPNHAPTLADFTLPELLLPALNPGSAGEVIGTLCQALEWSGCVPDSKRFFEAVMRREKVCSTAAPESWALPHARMEGLRQLFFAVGKLTAEMNWLESKQRVRMVFLFAVPEGDMTYLRLIAGVARLTMDQTRMAQLQAASQAKAMYEVLRGVPMPAPAGSRLAKF